MKTNIFKTVQQFLLILFLGVFTLSLLSCSSDDGGGTNDPEGDNFKITVTLNGVSADDYVSISAAGTDAAQNTSIWKVNGEVQNGQIAVGLNEDDFSGETTTYVLETTREIIALAAGIQIITTDNQITGSFKIEKGGTVEVNETINVSNGNDFTRHYNF